MFLEVETKKDIDWNKEKNSCLKKIEQWDKPAKLVLSLPADLSLVKVWDVPMLIKQINEATLWENLPETASFIEIKKYLWSLVTILKNKGQTELSTKYEKLYKTYYADTWLVSDPTIMEKLQWTYDLWNKDAERDIESDFSFFLKKHLFESVLEWSTKMLYTYMKSPDSDQYGSLLQSLADEWKKLTDARNSWDEKQELNAEKALITKIFENVSKYEDFVDNVNKYSFPSDVLQSKEMLCLSKTILVSGLLDHFGIENGVVKQYRHIFNFAMLRDWKKYFIDWTDELPYKIDKKIYDIDKKKKVLYESDTGDDKEDIFLWDLLLNSTKEAWYSSSYDILPLELSIKIDPKNIGAYIDLWILYANNMRGKEWIAVLGKAKLFLESLPSNRNIKFPLSIIEKKIKEIKKSIE